MAILTRMPLYFPSFARGAHGRCPLPLRASHSVSYVTAVFWPLGRAKGATAVANKGKYGVVLFSGYRCLTKGDAILAYCSSVGGIATPNIIDSGK